ncbi:MAG TPA: VWA domain-containing protein [Thermoanaerobaculia bacterium]
MTAISRFPRDLGFAALALLMLVTGRSDGAQKNSAPPGASDQIEVTVVEVPVEVTRGSEPVKGLTAADFAVLEKGRSLPIVSFETIDLEAPEKSGTPPSPAARRHLLFLFDFAFSNPERIARGVTEARKLAASGLDPHDMVGVGVYLPKGELHLLLSFTTDRAAAARTLGALESVLTGKASEVPGGDSDPLRVTGLGARSLLAQAWKIDETNFAFDMLASLGAPDGTMGGFLQKNVLSHSSELHQGHVESLQRAHVKAQLDALAGLAEILRPVQGRKYLALFSDGFRVNLIHYRPSSTFWSPYSGGSDLLKKLESTVEELRRSGWLLHVVDLAGTRGTDLGGNGLFYLANETGGTMVEGTNKFAEGLGGVMKKSAHAYLLTVQVDAAPDGSFHPLDVRLRNGRKAKVRHRSGYFAPVPFNQQKDVQRLAEAARLVAGDEERDDLGIQVMAVPLRSGGESTPVAVVVEVPGAPILAGGAPRPGLEVFGYALDDQGNSDDFFAQAVELDRSKVGTRLAQGGVRVLGKLDLAPGKHRLRVLVRDRNDGRVSLLSLPLSLAAAPAATGARIDALFLPPADDPWLLVRSVDTSFDLHGRSVLPAAQATLPAAGEAQVLLLGRGITAKGAWVRGRILTPEGKPVTGGEVELLTMTPGEGGEPDLVMGKLRVGSLPPGDYLLELRVGREAGPVQAVTARPFLVTERRPV